MLKRRVLLVEDHPMYRKGVKRLLEDTGRFQVVGEAVNGHDAIHQADVHRPEIVLIDIQLPGVTGLKIARVLRKQHHNMKIVFLSMHLDDERLFDAIRSGAMAFLTKDIDQEALVDSLRRVAQGENLINQLILSRPQLAWKVLSEFRQLTGDNEEGREREIAFAALPLSAREIEVLDCVAQGLSNKEIAAALGVAVSTVHERVAALHAALGTHTRAQLVAALGAIPHPAHASA